MAFGFFNKIKEGLEKTRKSFVSNVERVIIGYAQIDDDFLDDLEAVMIQGDLGIKTTEYLMKERSTKICLRADAKCSRMLQRKRVCAHARSTQVSSSLSHAKTMTQ